MNVPRRRLKTNFLEALFGLLLQPASISRTLMATPTPPYWGTLYLCALATLFVPIITQIIKLDLLVLQSQFLVALFLVCVFTVLIFVLVEALFLHMIGIPITVAQMLATVAYSLTPAVVLVWVLYGVNYYQDNSLTMITIILTGYGQIDYLLAKLFPYALMIANIMGLLIFYFCLQMVGNLHVITGIFITGFSLFPFYIALFLSVALAEFSLPGSIAQFLFLFPWLRGAYQLLPNF